MSAWVWLDDCIDCDRRKEGERCRWGERSPSSAGRSITSSSSSLAALSSSSESSSTSSLRYSSPIQKCGSLTPEASLSVSNSYSSAPICRVMPWWCGLRTSPFLASTSVPNLLWLSSSTNCLSSWRYLSTACTLETEMSSDILTSTSFFLPMFICCLLRKVMNLNTFPSSLPRFFIIYSTMQGFSGLGMSTVQNFWLSRYMRYLQCALHIQQTRGFQLMVTLKSFTTAFICFDSHCFRQSRCTYLTVPVHLQGVIKGLLVRPPSKQILHMFSGVSDQGSTIDQDRPIVLVDYIGIVAWLSFSNSFFYFSTSQCSLTVSLRASWSQTALDSLISPLLGIITDALMSAGTTSLTFIFCLPNFSTSFSLSVYICIINQLLCWEETAPPATVDVAPAIPSTRILSAQVGRSCHFLSI